MSENARNWCLHEDTQKWFEYNVGTEPWITIYKPAHINSSNNEDWFIWSFLISHGSIKEELKAYTFQQFEGIPTTDRFKNDDVEYFYKRCYYDDRESIFFKRRFPGNIHSTEISQEFVLFFNLFFDDKEKTYILIDPDGNREPVVKFETNGSIQFSQRRLKQYLAFKNMSLVNCISIRRFFNDELGDGLLPTNNKQVKVRISDIIHYAIWYQELRSEKWRFFTEIIGKKIIHPMPLEETGIFPFEKEPEFEKFIIGQDENGNSVEFECDPNNLANSFGANECNPHYLTPVFFYKEVLRKYYNNSELFKVQDGYIEIGEYLLRADTNQKDFVMVFLGDLGTNIPFSEQKYWRAFNLQPIGEMSKTEYERAFLGKFSDPESEQFIFRNYYNELQKNWTKKSGWPLFKPVNQGDLYRLDNIRIPLSENQQEFDQQVESLAILLVDSINKAEIDNAIQDSDPETKSIQSLERLCKNNFYSGYETHIAFLRKLFNLRSRGSSHRKGSSDYKKIKAEWRLEEDGFIKVFREILINAIDLLKFFITITKEQEK